MEQPATQAQRDEFDQRNNFLYFVLGMISLSYSVLGSIDGQLQGSRVVAEDNAAATRPAKAAGEGTPNGPEASLLI